MSVRIDPFKTQKVIEKGMKAGASLDLCSCKTTECTIVTTCMVAGGVIGGVASIPAGGVGAVPGVCIGLGVGVAIVAVRKAIRNSECTIL